MKSITLIIILVLITKAHLYGDPTPACGTTTGNSIVRRIDRVVDVALSLECYYTVPDLRTSWMRRTGKGWRTLGSLRQIPVQGTRVSIKPGLCPNQYISVIISADFINNNGTPLILSDDRYCSMSVADSFRIFDNTPPPIRNISFNISDVTFSGGDLSPLLRSEFYLSDNCSSFLSVDLLSEEASPEFSIDCRSKTIFNVFFRLTDGCSNHSRWALVTIHYVDVLPPTGPSIFGPSMFVLNSDCRVRISPEEFFTSSSDDWTPPSSIRYSYRVISPSRYRGNIPPGGRWLDADGSCPANDVVQVRVCAQDCFGNGDLHLSDDVVGINCNYLYVRLKDTLAPQLVSGCGATVNILANCTAVMPNLAPTLITFENCSDVTIYQLPKPGTLLNDGVSNSLGVALGTERSFSCGLPDEADPIIDCKSSSGVFKSISVSFVLIDCDGNCTVKQNCITLNLSAGAGLASAQGLFSNSAHPGSTNPRNTDHHIAVMEMVNQPNPFYDYTSIKINASNPGTGILHFYTASGQQLLSRTIKINTGVNSIKINKNELGMEGLVFYSLTISKDGSGQQKVLWNKMMVF